MATLTITTTAQDAARVAAAFGPWVGNQPGTPATPAQIKQAVIEWIKRIVQQQEQQVAIEAIVPSTPIDPT